MGVPQNRIYIYIYIYKGKSLLKWMIWEARNVQLALHDVDCVVSLAHLVTATVRDGGSPISGNIHVVL